MADGAVLKIVKTPYLREKSSEFDEIYCTLADYELDDIEILHGEAEWHGGIGHVT